MSSGKDLIGTQLGRYRIVEHLATGGMAEIFLARHEGLAQFRKELVLKVLQSRWEGHAEIVELFLGEARISALMNHPNIVEVFDVAEDGGRHFIAMEHIAGHTLTEIAKRAIQVAKSIPVEVGTFIAAEIAGALAHMHDGQGSKGQPLCVVHRDISPTNILVNASGQVKLIDFGIARQGLSIKEESGARLGKITYMSPEQVRGDAIDGRSDIFCLGTILYEITLGRRLWRGPREVASKRILEERPKPPTFVRHDYPSELELIVLRTLEKKPPDRYQSAVELYQDLHGFLARSNAYLRNNVQLANYVEKIFSEEAEALISDAGRRRAQAFVEGEEPAEGTGEDLDFDLRQAEGPGAALARALRASALGVWAEVNGKSGPERASSEPEPRLAPADAEGQPGAKPVEKVEPVARDAKPAAREVVSASGPAPAGAPAGAKEAAGPETGSVAKGKPLSAGSAAGAGVPDRVPRRWSGIVWAGIVVVLVAAAVVWWLRSE